MRSLIDKLLRVKLLRVMQALAASILILGCSILTPEAPGVIGFPDFEEQTKLMGDNAGLMNFSSMLVPDPPSIDPQRNIKPLNIENSGEGPLTITNLHILQTAVPESNPAAASDAFSFVEGAFPVLPLVIPAGATVNDIFVEFLPETAGEYRAKLFVETADNSHYVDLIGTGLWQLTLNDNADGTLTILAEDEDDNIVAGSGDPAVATSVDGVFNIIAETVFLREFKEWQTDSGSAVFDNEKSAKTTVVLESHAEISASIINPYTYVEEGYSGANGDYFDNLQDAINACDGVTKTAVVVSAGTYSESDITFAAGIPVYGGYQNDVSENWSAPRTFETAADRLNPTFACILNVSGTINISGSNMLNNVVLEGFIINKTGGGDAPPVKFDDGTTAGLRYNTVTGGGTNSSAAVLVTNGAAPLIKYNYLTGGDVTADYAESYGLMITEGAAPVVYKNSIRGGSASGQDAASFGIFCDFEAEPYIRNNTPLEGHPWGVAGGEASGSGGRSYGIYIINNGNILAEYNTISGGTGGTAVAMYSKYGSYIDAYHNNIFTAAGSTRIGLWADFSGRVYHLEHNAIYDCGTALYKDPYSGNLTAIEAVNSKYHTSTNSASVIDLSEAPAEVAYE